MNRGHYHCPFQRQIKAENLIRILKKLGYNSKWTEWTCRLLLSFNILVPGLLLGDIDHFYPLDVLLLTLIGFWLYVYKVHLFSIALLFLPALINFQRVLWNL